MGPTLDDDDDDDDDDDYDMATAVVISATNRLGRDRQAKEMCKTVREGSLIGRICNHCIFVC